MKRIIGVSILLGVLVLTSCGSKNQKKEMIVKDISLEAPIDNAAPKTYAASTVDNKKDPSCGMPVTAGISDTAHYDNHVIGFCSTECKNEFLKNPKAGLAAAELKK